MDSFGHAFLRPISTKFVDRVGKHILFSYCTLAQTSYAKEKREKKNETVTQESVNYTICIQEKTHGCLTYS